MQNVRVNFTLKKPGSGRKSFSILKREIRNNKPKCKKLKLESIDALNKVLRTGIQDASQCEQAAKEIIKALYLAEEKKYPKQVYNSQNRQLLEKYWKAEYEDRDLVDFVSAKNDLKRAIEALGPLSLYSSSKEEIQRQINKTVSGNTQRRVVMAPIPIPLIFLIILKPSFKKND